VRCDVPVVSDALLATDFINLKIKPAQSFGGAHRGRVGAHRGRVCVHVFIWVCACTYMSIYICTVFLKKIWITHLFAFWLSIAEDIVLKFIVSFHYNYDMYHFILI
jgi:hypothetical protein